MGPPKPIRCGGCRSGSPTASGSTAALPTSTTSPTAASPGSIYAALFMQDFIEPGVPWVHFDLFAWNPYARPGRPEGAEAQTIRAVYALIAARFGGGRAANGSKD